MGLQGGQCSQVLFILFPPFTSVTTRGTCNFIAICLFIRQSMDGIEQGEIIIFVRSDILIIRLV